MAASAALLIVSTVFLWGVFSRRLGRADLTAPIIFALAGLLLTQGPPLLPAIETTSIRLLAEVTLVWVLFSDASRVSLRSFRTDLGLYLRLLGIGLPLTVALGVLAALWLYPGLGIWLALLIGAALAPTDAALGTPVMTNAAVPARVRRMINVESGLNDGIVTPVVAIAIGGVAAAEGFVNAPTVLASILDLFIGALAGAAIGGLGGWLVRACRARDWSAEGFAGPAILALALIAYTGSQTLHGNGFVAAFVAGLAFGHTAGRGGHKEAFYVEQTGGLASLLSWLLFGAVVVPTVFERIDWRVAVYAVLSLTVIRMVPVALALAGSRLTRLTMAFLGWFGPRGLASLIFALLALEELGPDADTAVAVIGATVLLSVLTHGLSAEPLAAAYGRRISARPQAVESRVTAELPIRRLLSHHTAGPTAGPRTNPPTPRPPRGGGA